MLHALITSKARCRILTLFLGHPEERFHVREIVRRTSENYNSVRRELNKLESIGVLKSARSANLRYYQMNRQLPIYKELKSIYVKTDGLGDAVRRNLGEMGKIETVFVFGSLAKNAESLTSDIDLFIVGHVDEDRLIQAVRKTEEELSREINYVLLTPEEYRKKVRGKDPFVANVLKEDKIMLIGEELETA